MTGLSGVDIGLLAALLLSVLVGLWRGLVYELMALVGWLVAWAVTLALAPRLAPHLPIGDPGSALNHAAALAIGFFLALIVWGLLARLVRMLISATPLTIPDRLLGAAFGLVRGLVLLMALAMVVALTPAVRSDAWQRSAGAQWLGVAIEGLRPLLPAAIARWIPPMRTATTPRGQ